MISIGINDGATQVPEEGRSTTLLGGDIEVAQDEPRQPNSAKDPENFLGLLNVATSFQTNKMIEAKRIFSDAVKNKLQTQIHSFIYVTFIN